MLSKLWVAQDLFAELQAVSVLLVLVTSLQKKTEQTLHQTSEADRSAIRCCTNPQTALSAQKGRFCNCAECLEVQSERDCSTERDGRKSTRWNSIDDDDGGLLMKCIQTSGQMDVPGSEQTPAQRNPPPVEILPTPTTIYSMHAGL